MEAFFKNECKKARSLRYWNIVRSFIEKYDHLVHLPFRDRVKDNYNLLKPKGSFFTLILVMTLATVWMLTVFLTFILQSSTDNVASLPMANYVGIAIGIAIVASIINFFTIKALFKLYVKNIRHAFKVHYDSEYANVDQNMKEYSPEDSEEEELIADPTAFQPKDT